MKRINFLLRFVSLADLLLIAYPFVSIAEVAFTKQVEPVSSALRFLLVFGCGLLGVTVGLLLDKLKNPPMRIVVFAIAAVPMSLYIAAYLYLAKPTLLHIVLAVLMVVLYLLGMFFSTQSFDELVGSSFLIFGTISYLMGAVILLICRASFGWEISIPILTGFFLLFILLYAIISNQSNIERMMGRRSYDMAMLPAGMRRYNILLIVSGFLLVLLGLFFQDGIKSLILGFLQLCTYFLMIFPLLYQLWLWIMRQGTYLDKPLSEVGVEVSQGLLPGGKESAFTPIMNFLFIWGSLLILLVFLFLARHHIWNFFKKSALFVWDLIQLLLTRKQKPSTQAVSSEYFSDTIENLDRNDVAEEVSEEVLSARSWRKACREFLKRSSSEENLKDGYRLILRWLILYGAPLAESDTTLEILNKALVRLPKSPFPQVTDGYNAVKYGESPLREGDWESLTSTLKTLYNMK